MELLQARVSALDAATLDQVEARLQVAMTTERDLPHVQLKTITLFWHLNERFGTCYTTPVVLQQMSDRFCLLYISIQIFRQICSESVF